MNKRYYLRLFCWFRALRFADKCKVIWFFTTLAFTLSIEDSNMIGIMLASFNFVSATLAIKTVPTEGLESLMD
jgi:hypothetical protein